MTIEQLNKDMIQAMKSGDTNRRDVLRAAIAAVKKAAIDKRCDINETLVDEVLTKEKKTIKEQLDTCPAGRSDLIQKYEADLAIITEYAPKVIDNPEEAKNMIGRLIAAAGIEPVKANKVAVMKTIMPQIKGKVDGKIANQVIGELLI